MADDQETNLNDDQPGAPDPQPGEVQAEDAVEAAQDAAEQAASGTEESAPSEAQAEALAAAAEALDQINDEASEAVEPSPEPGESEPAGVELPAFARDFVPEGEQNVDLLSDVKLNVRIELGRTHMLVEDILKLGAGAVVELDKLAGDPVDVFVNERHVAKGEVLVLNDNFCVRVSEILTPDSDGAGR